MKQIHYLTLRKTLYALFLLSAVSVSFLYCPLKVSANSPNSWDSPEPFEVKEGWQYRWGDSPVNTYGIPIWTQNSSISQGWYNFRYLSKPSGYKGANNIWLKVALPNINPENPYLYIKTLNQAFEVYIEDELIYKYSDINSPSQRKMLGYSNHFIPLPPDYQKKYVFFRIFSRDSSNIGVIRNFLLGSKADILEYIIHKDIYQVVLAFLFIFVGFITIIIYLYKFRGEKAYFSIGLFSLCIGIWSITQTDIKLIFYNTPNVWYYIDILSLYLIPTGICSFVVQIFKVKNELLLKYLWKFFILYEFLIIILDISNIFPMYSTLGPFFILLLLTMLTLVYTVVKKALSSEINAIIFSIGLIFLCVFGTYDILVGYLRIISSKINLTPTGMFVFLLCLIAILVRRFLEVHNKLKTYSNEIETKNEALNHMFLEIKSSKDKIAQWSKGLEQAVMIKTASIRNLLDNAGQGFLSFGKDMIINKEYSNECIKIFDKEIKDKNFAELIFPDNDEQKDFLKNIIENILLEDNYSKKSVLLSLIPDETLINSKHIHIDYKLINGDSEDDNKSFMVILTDITEKRYLEKQMEQERYNLKMVVKVVVYYNDFIECVKDYKFFCIEKIHTLLKSKLSLEEIIFGIFRDVHTFKGSFSQMDMMNVVEQLNEFENKISFLCKNIANTNLSELKNIISGLNMYEWLEKDLTILKSILGEQFFKLENIIKIDKSKLLEIENSAIALLSSFECRLLLPRLKMLRYKPFKELLKSYPQYALRLSDQFEKLINPVIIEGGDFPVDTDIYYGFTRSLTHVFRNIIDHGIEPIEDRLSKGKSEFGNISCNISILNKNIALVISDDGHGIDVDLIRKKALESGLIDKEEALELSNEEILNFIFKEGFSTKDIASEISGRGMGLYSIKSEVDNLGGTVEVKSKEGEGTGFYFLLPYEDLFDLHDIPVTTYIKPIVDTTKTLYNEQTGLTLEDIGGNGIEKVENVLLKDVSVFINIKGVVEGTFIMSSDEILAREIIRNFIAYNAVMYNLPEDESSFVSEDVLSEFFNTIMGNSIKAFTESEDLIAIDIPLTLNTNKAALLKYPGSGIWTCNLGCSEGSLSITFMTSKY